MGLSMLFPDLPERIAMSRAWCMPSADTFEMAPCAALLDRWLIGRSVIVDPFARNGRRGTLRNDLNPETRAEYHMDAVAFCDRMLADGVIADAVLFDPPYSVRQIAECYKNVGRVVGREETQGGVLEAAVKDRLARMLRPGGVALSFGWNSIGFGRTRECATREILLCCHGGAHNDTICVVEERS
jgi:hypothetical protein